MTLADTPVGGTSVTVRWRKRIWSCPETACVVKTWTEQASLAAPRQVITARGAAVGGRSARRGRGDGGVVGSSVAGDMVNGVGCGRAHRRDPCR